MLKRLPGTEKDHPRRWPATLAMLLFIVLCTMSACSNGSGRGTVAEDGQMLSGEATLVCNQECSDRAFCGLAGQEPTILLNSSGPATTDFDLAVAGGTTVLITTGRMETVVQVSNQEKQRVPFYQVQIPGGGSGWVAAWCISQ